MILQSFSRKLALRTVAGLCLDAATSRVIELGDHAQLASAIFGTKTATSYLLLLIISLAQVLGSASLVSERARHLLRRARPLSLLSVAQVVDAKLSGEYTKAALTICVVVLAALEQLHATAAGAGVGAPVLSRVLDLEAALRRLATRTSAAVVGPAVACVCVLVVLCGTPRGQHGARRLVRRESVDNWLSSAAVCLLFGSLGRTPPWAEPRIALLVHRGLFAYRKFVLWRTDREKLVKKL